MSDLKLETQEAIGGKEKQSKLDLRRTELEMKKETGEITREEDAELIGLRVFPNDPKGAKLRKKEVLGSITQEEKARLIRLNKLNTRGEEFSAEVISLWERAEANDPNVMKVDMNSGGSVEVQQAD